MSYDEGPIVVFDITNRNVLTTIPNGWYIRVYIIISLQLKGNT